MQVAWPVVASTGCAPQPLIVVPPSVKATVPPSGVGSSGLIAASSNGTSWTTQTSGTTQALDAVAFVDGGFGWAVGGGGVIDALGCRSGGLNLTPPSTLTFPATTLSGLNQTLSGSASVTVDDETGSGAGWNLDVTSTTFTNTASQTLPTTASTITAVTPSAGTGRCLAPTNAISYPVTVPAAATAPTAVKIYDAAVDSGAGPTNLSLSASLAVPSSTRSGSYSSTWTFTLASGP